MTPKQKIARFLIGRCGLRRLHGSRVQKFIRSILDEIDLQHVRQSYPCQNFADRWRMWKFVNEQYARGAAIDYLEFGVFEGESMQHWTALNMHNDSRFFGFDSFEGLPTDWHGEKGKGYFSVLGEAPHMDDSRVKFVKGWFENTIPPFARDFSVRNHLVIHIDCDLYAGAMLALVYLSPIMSKGTILIFDEFFDRENEFKAFTDWQKIFGKRVQVIAEVENYAQIAMEVL